MGTVRVTCADPATSKIYADVDGAGTGIDSALQSHLPYCLFPVAGVYPPRPAWLGPVFFMEGGPQPAITGSTAGGGGFVDGLDRWFNG